MANEFKVRKGLIVYGSGSSPVLDVQGSQGQLFSITDSLSGSLWSVNDISGIPVMEAFSDNTVKIGTYGNEAIIVSGSSTGMGTATPTAKLHISGSSGSALFEIDSPALNNIVFVSGSGNVGFGTSTPSKRVEIFDNAAGDGLSVVRSSVTSQRIELIPNDGTATALIKGGGNNKPFYIASWANGGTAQPLYFGTNYTTGTNEVRMTISTTGNVGIGNLTPSYRLDVSGSGNFTNNLIVTGSLTVSGSSTLTNIGPAIFSGSLAVTAGITGSLLGTASYSTIAETVTNQDYAIVYAIVL